jgi:hypothetical protein
MKKLVSCLICILICKTGLFSQSIQYDYTKLSWHAGSNLVTDATALKAKVLVRYAASPNETAWFGPYLPLQSGTYQIQFRLKVSDNSSTATICKIDVWSNTTGILYDTKAITPSMFSGSNQWQTFTLNVLAPATAPDIELRGMEFKSGIADLYLDYINVIKTPDFFASVGSTGNVGIGTTTPQAMLAVNGEVLCKKVRVSQNSANWPDYVFQQGYPLPDLKEVAEYIKQNNHLPGVPSAAEVKKDGLDLADNQATLLKKIEELTLYAIEQNKKLEQQQQQLKEQQVLVLQLNQMAGRQQKSKNTLKKRVK